VSCNVHLAQRKFVVIFVIENIHQVRIERMNILSIHSNNAIFRLQNRNLINYIKK